MGYILEFGKHEGEDITSKTVPTSYLQWIADTFDREDDRYVELLEEIDEELERRVEWEEMERPWWERQ